MKKKVDLNKRQIILKAAKRLFAENGYDNTSVRDIVVAANTSMGNLYYHFPNKHEMLREICDEFVNILRRQIGDVRKMDLRPELGFALDFRIGYITTLEHPKTSQFWVASRNIQEIHQNSLENKRIRLKTFFGDLVTDEEINLLAVAIQGIADAIFEQKRQGVLVENSAILSNTIIDYSLRLLGFSRDDINTAIKEVDDYIAKKHIKLDEYFLT
jgi:AcrR family transcriptional regulator